MRELDWDGYPNCRELGGLPIAAEPGASTALGRVARGPRRERLTPDGWSQARAWGLRTVVDLRSPAEIGARPGDPEFDDDAWSPATVLLRPTEDQTDPEFRRRCLPILDSPEYWAHNWELQPALVAAAIDAITSAEPGVLVHCSAGRDRTGMISALLLGNAGVTVDAVVEDYARGVFAMAGASAAAPHDRMSNWTVAQVDDWLTRTTPIVGDVARDAPTIRASLGVGARTRSLLRDLLRS